MRLTPREREVMKRRRTETLQAIAASWGVTRARVRQVESSAIRKVGDVALVCCDSCGTVLGVAFKAPRGVTCLACRARDGIAV